MSLLGVGTSVANTVTCFVIVLVLEFVGRRGEDEDDYDSD
jgi:hypothetical protein